MVVQNGLVEESQFLETIVLVESLEFEMEKRLQFLAVKHKDAHCNFLIIIFSAITCS